jgi:hypothetical protein
VRAKYAGREDRPLSPSASVAALLTQSTGPTTAFGVSAIVFGAKPFVLRAKTFCSPPQIDSAGFRAAGATTNDHSSVVKNA